MKNMPYQYLGKMSDTGEAVYGYTDENGKLHTNIKVRTLNSQMLYHCEHCGQDYIVSEHFEGFIPHCYNCGAIMKKGVDNEN